MKTLYILSGFNNYYNRMVKLPGDNREDYPQEVYTLDATNFVPNDGVNTEHVVGTYDYDGQGDYLLVTEMRQVPDADYPDTLVWKEVVVQRWFIIDSVRNRQGQYTLTLRRDLIADYYNIIAESPMFIEKATLNNNDPFIVNSENMTFNQIKTKEFKLKDGTNCPWIVGYYDSTHTDTDHSNYKMYIDEQEPFPFDIAEATTFENWEYYKYISEDFIGDPANLQYLIGASNLINYEGTIQYVITNSSSSAKLVSDIVPAVGFRGTPPNHAVVKQAMLDYYPHPQGLKTFEAQTYNGSYIRFHNTNSSASKKFKNLNGKIVRFSSDVEDEYVYKKIVIKPKQATYTTQVQAGNLYNSLKGVMENLNATSIPQQNLSPFYVSLTTESYRIETEDIIPGRLVANIDKTAYNLTDAPYSMFAIPYPQEDGQTVIIKNTGTNTTVNVNAEAGMRAAMSFAKKYVSGNVIYDIQLLPYCPIQSLVKEDGSLDLMNDNLLYSYITINDENVSVILNASVSSFTLNIPFELLEVENQKIQSQTDMCRLVSPNYNGQFEFNIIKNGDLQFFNVDCTYLPHTPYIHLNPNFSFLYGQDFNDARGLICGGDFSLPIVKDAWEAYKIQNKNFQNIFDRQIQNMEINLKYQAIGDVVGAIAGTASGAAGGALAGSAVAPGIGTAVGAIVGGVTSAAGGIADVAINNKLRAEALDYTKDLFGFLMGNIQALPNSISRTTAYTYNNKIFPILEYYTCTDIEKTALANKIAYNGMTVGRIGTINEFSGNRWSYGDIEDKGYIKGQLIRLSEIGEDFYIANSISGELYKGIYLR